MPTSKAVHWREREAAEWVARHGAPDTFKIETGEIQDRRMLFRKTTGGDVLAKLGDPAWKIIHLSWHSKELRSPVRSYTIEFLPAALMGSHGKNDIKRYHFDVPDAANVDKALKKKRSDDLAPK
jgi:hypothetical protein